MGKNHVCDSQLPEIGFVRLDTVLKMIPVGTTAWYQGIREGRFPRPISLGPRTRAYRVEDIRLLIQQLGQNDS